MTEEVKEKKDDNIFGFTYDKLGAITGGLALLGVAALIWDKFKPTLPGLPQQQPQLQQQPNGHVQNQPQLQQPQPQYQPQPQQIPNGYIEQPQPQQQPFQPGTAIEQDPMGQKQRRVRIPEVQTEGQETDRFSSISV